MANKERRARKIGILVIVLTLFFLFCLSVVSSWSTDRFYQSPLSTIQNISNLISSTGYVPMTALGMAQANDNDWNTLGNFGSIGAGEVADLFKTYNNSGGAMGGTINIKWKTLSGGANGMWIGCYDYVLTGYTAFFFQGGDVLSPIYNMTTLPDYCFSGTNPVIIDIIADEKRVGVYDTSIDYGLTNETLTFPVSPVVLNDTGVSPPNGYLNTAPYETCALMSISRAGRLNVTAGLDLTTTGNKWYPYPIIRIRDTSLNLIEEVNDTNRDSSVLTNLIYPKATYYFCVRNINTTSNFLGYRSNPIGVFTEYCYEGDCSGEAAPAIKLETNPLDVTRYLVVPSFISLLTNGQFNLTGWIPTSSSGTSTGYGVVPTNQIAYYKLDESSGAVIDQTGNNNGVNHGATPGVVGQVNTAYYFNTTAKNNVSLGSGSVAITTSPMTINAWVNLSTPRPLSWYVVAPGACNGYLFYIHGTSNLSFGKECGTDTKSNVFLPKNRFTMITASYNTTHVAFYIDGLSVANNTLAQTFDPGLEYLLGYTSGGSFNGTMDEVGIWNKALNATEVYSIFQATNGSGVGGTSNNASLIIGNDLRNLSVSSNGTIPLQVTINNLATNVNKYLTSSYLVGSNYIIPFTFISQGIGSLFDSAITFNNLGFLENSVSYSTPILESTSNTIVANYSFGSAPSSITLNYGGINSTPSVLITGQNYILTSNLVSPSVNIDTALPFYYTFTIGGINYTSTVNTQNILNVNLLSTCGLGTYNFLNITNFDEETLNPMSGTVEYTLYLQGANSQIASIIGNATGTNLTFCTNINISNNYTTYNLQLRYYAPNYVYKTYNIQNSPTLNLPIVLPLYFLNNTIGTKFKISYVDFNYLTYPGAVLQIQRQYLSEGVYRIVEAPAFDNNGVAVGSFNTNNIRYKLIVLNNGVVQDIFNDIFPVCQNIVLGTCEISLRGAENPQVTTIGDFTYNMVKTNDSLILTYVIPSGTPRTIEFITNQNSLFLNNISNCDTSIFASSGTITCTYNQTVGDSIISTHIINSDGTQFYGQVQVSEDLSGFYLLNNYFIGFILLLLLALMFMSSGFILVIVTVGGVIFLGLIFLLRGFDFTTIAGSLGWLIIAAVIIIYSLSKKEEKT